MTEQRRPGRPKQSEEQVGRDRIIEGAIDYLRKGRISNTRRDIAALLGVNPSLISYYFPEGISLLQDAVEDRSRHWSAELDKLLHGDAAAADRLYGLQSLLMAMFKTDVHLLHFRAQLAREGLMPSCLVTELRTRSERLFPTGDAPLLALSVWGTTEAMARDESNWAILPFDSTALADGRLVLTS